MARVFGREYTKQQLLEKIGNIDQLAEVQRVSLRGGKREGGEAVLFRTGGGLSFTAVANRALDISRADYKGMSLCWRSPVGEVHPSYFEPPGFGWLRSFAGGLLVTCGLTWFGHPHQDPEGGMEAEGGLGLHGRISHVPAENLCVDSAWEGDDYVMWAQAKMREAMVFGPNLVLNRKISTKLGENKIWIQDVVTNEGFADQDHMLLYHANLGFPLLDEGGEYLIPSTEVIPHNEFAEQFVDQWRQFPAPQTGQEEMVYCHRLAGQSDGTTYVAFANRHFNHGQGLGLYIKFNIEMLPWMLQWKMPGINHYVTGMEPCTATGHTRPAEREAGRVISLAPGQQRTYDLEFGVLSNQQEIDEIEQLINGLT